MGAQKIKVALVVACLCWLVPASAGQIMRLYQQAMYDEAAALIERGAFQDAKDYIAAAGMYQHGHGGLPRDAVQANRLLDKAEQMTQRPAAKIAREPSPVAQQQPVARQPVVAGPSAQPTAQPARIAHAPLQIQSPPPTAPQQGSDETFVVLVVLGLTICMGLLFLNNKPKKTSENHFAERPRFPGAMDSPQASAPPLVTTSSVALTCPSCAGGINYAMVGRRFEGGCPHCEAGIIVDELNNITLTRPVIVPRLVVAPETPRLSGGVGYVYVLHNLTRRTTKVGKTTRPLRRTGEVSGELAGRKNIVRTALFECDSEDDAIAVEKAAHRALRHLNIGVKVKRGFKRRNGLPKEWQTEWFTATPDEAANAVEKAASSIGKRVEACDP